MPLAETVAITAGNAVAKWIFSAWLGDGLFKELTGSFTDTFTARLSDSRQQRRFKLQGAQIVDRTADKLAALIEAEFPAIPANEQNAAAEAVVVTLERGLPDISLAGLNFDSLRFKEALQERDLGRRSAAGLSADGERLYELVLSESAAYIVEVVTSLPRFTSTGIIELLQRNSALIDMVTDIYEKMPALQADQRARTSARQFEINYLRHIARKLDKLELFGVSASELSSRYALSVAYITLMVIDPTALGTAEGTDEPAASKQSETLRVDDAIANYRRVFLRGVAGSGKTTLLQWLAVRAARGEFAGNMRDWNGAVPFFIQPPALPAARGQPVASD